MKIRVREAGLVSNSVNAVENNGDETSTTSMGTLLKKMITKNIRMMAKGITERKRNNAENRNDERKKAHFSPSLVEVSIVK